MKNSASTYLFILAGVIVIGLIGYAVLKPQTPSEHDALAKCLTEKGVKMWGAWWCPHCENQKEEFGNAFKHINYIECSPGRTRTMSQQCKDAGIKGYPTWEFSDSSRLSGEVELDRLAEKAGCEDGGKLEESDIEPGAVSDVLSDSDNNNEEVLDEETATDDNTEEETESEE